MNKTANTEKYDIAVSLAKRCLTRSKDFAADSCARFKEARTACQYAATACFLAKGDAQVNDSNDLIVLAHDLLDHCVHSQIALAEDCSRSKVARYDLGLSESPA